MPPNAPEDLSSLIETLYRSESGRILATLLRLLGDLDLAEEAMQRPSPPPWRRGRTPAFPTSRALAHIDWAIQGHRRHASEGNVSTSHKLTWRFNSKRA